ncbi:MAG: iron-containing alcohol dehydrogenase, partial [Mesotoga sp.]|nr:iron-containing alcohol dehydrogenase [Mesotoga sp.]
MWKYFLPTKIFAGIEIISENAELLREVGTNAFLVTGKSSAKKCGALDEVLSVLRGLDIPNTVFDEVEENPSFATIEKGGKKLSSSGCDFVIAIGGGSPLDAAKAISVIGMNSECDCRDLYTGQNLPAFPIIAIPTTSGTGSEVTPYSILTDGEGTK